MFGFLDSPCMLHGKSGYSSTSRMVTRGFIDTFFQFSCDQDLNLPYLTLVNSICFEIQSMSSVLFIDSWSQSHRYSGYFITISNGTSTPDGTRNDAHIPILCVPHHCKSSRDAIYLINSDSVNVILSKLSHLHGKSSMYFTTSCKRFTLLEATTSPRQHISKLSMTKLNGIDGLYDKLNPCQNLSLYFLTRDGVMLGFIANLSQHHGLSGYMSMRSPREVFLSTLNILTTFIHKQISYCIYMAFN